MDDRRYLVWSSTDQTNRSDLGSSGLRQTRCQQNASAAAKTLTQINLNLQGNALRQREVAFSPDGQTLFASANEDDVRARELGKVGLASLNFSAKDLDRLDDQGGGDLAGVHKNI